MWSLKKKTETGSFQLLGRRVEYIYDGDVDALTLKFSDRPIAETRETELGLMDLDGDGDLVAFEVFSARKVVKRLAENTTKTPNQSRESLRPASDLTDDLTAAVNERLAEAVAEAGERVKALA